MAARSNPGRRDEESGPQPKLMLGPSPGELFELDEPELLGRMLTSLITSVPSTIDELKEKEDDY